LLVIGIATGIGFDDEAKPPACRLSLRARGSTGVRPNRSEKMCKEGVKLFVGITIRRMVLPTGHRHSIGEAKQSIYLDEVIQRQPARRRILRAARDQERPGSDERVQFVQIAPLFDQVFVSAGARILGGGNPGPGSLLGRVEAEVPRLPIIHIRARLVE
jgi:hypothetical protein